MDGNAVRDMGLSVDDVTAITSGYLYAQSVLYPQIIARGKFIWDQTLNHDPFAPLNGDCPQPWVKKDSCASDLRGLCSPTAAPQQNRTLLYGFSPGSCTGTDPSHLTEVDTDVANFLLVRGPYAFLGNGVSGRPRHHARKRAQSARAPHAPCASGGWTSQGGACGSHLARRRLRTATTRRRAAGPRRAPC